MVEPTVVVAMAAALANVGAAMLEKLTEVNVAAEEPPQPTLSPAAAKAPDKGNKGMPDKTCKIERRETLGLLVIR
jgi:hypothetical protein